MHDPKYCLFYDNHTLPDYSAVGAEFDAEEFAERIKRCGVDYITFHARCNMGVAYYDTEIGIKHPSLKYDMFGRIVESCKKRGIAVTAYFNGGISEEEGLRNRDWTTLYFDGSSFRKDRTSPFVRTMCYNTPYRDRLISMMLEVARSYPVDGFFVDCMHEYPCICPQCIREMKERGIDWEDEEEVIKFSRFSAKRLASDISSTLKNVNPEYLLYFNGVFHEDQADSGTYLECECIPSRSCWGYEYLPVLSHYMRTLGKTCLNMTARFNRWGDFGGLRPENALKSELLYGLANGMRPNVGDHFHPRGDIMNPVFDRIEKVYKDIQKYDEWFDNAVNETEIAVVYPRILKKIRYDSEVRGAVRMLSELKQQFDIVTHAADWSKYKVLILPDTLTLDPESSERIKKHLKKGGKIISSGKSGLDLSEKDFVFAEDWGVKYGGECACNPAYFTLSGEFAKDIPCMPLSLYAKGIKLKSQNAAAHGKIIKPETNFSWDGLYPQFYNPPHEETEWPFLTVSDNVAHFSHEIFTGYKMWTSTQLRQAFSNALEHFLARPLVKTENMPSFSRVFVSAQNNRTIVHILAYMPEKRGNDSEIIEDELLIDGAKIALRLDGDEISRVYQAPDKCEIDFSVKDGYANVKLPQTRGYSIIIFEK